VWYLLILCPPRDVCLEASSASAPGTVIYALTLREPNTLLVNHLLTSSLCNSVAVISQGKKKKPKTKQTILIKKLPTMDK